MAGQAEGSRLTVTNFHDLLMQLLEDKGQAPAVPEGQAARGHFFREELPDLAFGLVSTLAEEEKYDALVVDEGQDFREEWFLILQEMLRDGEGGEYYIFADPCQAIFNTGTDALASFEVSRHRLTQNLRNSELINDWLGSLVEGGELRCTSRGGFPVGFFPWQRAEPGSGKRVTPPRLPTRLSFSRSSLSRAWRPILFF